MARGRAGGDAFVALGKRIDALDEDDIWNVAVVQRISGARVRVRYEGSKLTPPRRGPMIMRALAAAPRWTGRMEQSVG